MTGATIINGAELHCSAIAIGAPMRVVRRDERAIGCTRYVVTDVNGRRAYGHARPLS